MQVQGQGWDSDGESGDNSDDWSDEGGLEHISDTSDSESDTSPEHSDQVSASKLVFDNEIVHRCFAQTGLNKSFLETFLWELNLDYRGVRQVIVGGEDYAHQIDQVPRVLFEKGGVLHEALHSLPHNAKVFEKLPTAMRLDGDNVDPVGSLHYIRDNLGFSGKIRRCFIGTVDAKTGLGSPYNSEVNTTTRDGDPMEKQGVVMEIDPSISLKQQTNINYSNSYHAIHKVLKRKHPLVSGMGSSFLGMTEDNDSDGDGDDMDIDVNWDFKEHLNLFKIPPSVNLGLLAHNAVATNFSNSMKDSELVNTSWETYEYTFVNPEEFSWIPNPSGFDSSVENSAWEDSVGNISDQFFLGVRDKKKHLNQDEFWNKFAIERILDYLLFCSTLVYNPSATQLTNAPYSIEHANIYLSSDKELPSEILAASRTDAFDLNQVDWVLERGIAIKNGDVAHFNGIVLHNGQKESFFLRPAQEQSWYLKCEILMDQNYLQ